jgi:ribonuclease Z
MRKPQIVFIGTTASTPTYTRYSPAILICGIKSCVLLDAGEAAQINLGRISMDLLKINVICITHMHGDHYYGLMPIIDTMLMRSITQNMQKPYTITILGPKELCSIYLKQFFTSSNKTENSYEIYNSDVARIECIDAENLANSKKYIQTVNGDILITSIHMNHGDVKAYGYIAKVKVSEKSDRFITIFYSGDGICSNECYEIVKKQNPCIIIHEATYMDYKDDKAKAYQTFHATIGDAALLAQLVKAKILVATHISLRYSFEWIRDYISRARRVFDGDIFIAEDLAMIPLDRIDC